MKLRGQEIIDAVERVFGPVMIVKWGKRTYSAPSTPAESPTPRDPRAVPPTSYEQRRLDDGA